MTIAEIRKALTPPVTAGLAWAALVVNSPSRPITAGEWLMGAGILATSLGVYAMSNDPAPVKAAAATGSQSTGTTIISPITPPAPPV